MAGPGSRHAGGRLIGDYGPFSVTGLTEAVKVVPRSFAMLRKLVDTARDLRPHVFVAIDFPDFNFKLMAALRRLGIPIVYYVSPQLWAWRPGRMDTMKEYVDRVLVIFPFEEALYRRAGVSVQFVGHPLVDLIRPGQSRAEFLRDRGLNPEAPTVALLPGSRRNELDRIVPVLTPALVADPLACPGRAVRRGVCAEHPRCDVCAARSRTSRTGGWSSCAIAPTTCWWRATW